MRTLKREQLDSIAFDGVNRRPSRDLVAETATMGLVLDLRAQVDIAAGGGADGALNVEQPLGLIRTIRVFDGSQNPVVEIEPRELWQLAARRGMQAPSGVALATPGIQAATLVRAHLPLFFSDRWSKDPIEVHLRPRDPRKFRVEIEWAGTSAADMAASLITGGTRAITITNLAVDILQVHDTVAFLKVRPLFLPRIRSYQVNAPASSARFPFEIKTTDRVRASLLHTLDADVSTEGIITTLKLKDDQREHEVDVLARTWHEEEQYMFGGVGDVAPAMAYYFGDYADNGKLSTVLSPFQGGNPRWVLGVVGGGARIIRAVNVELEQVAGITAQQLPPGLD
jgi:hypothetical protein